MDGSLDDWVKTSLKLQLLRSVPSLQWSGNIKSGGQSLACIFCLVTGGLPVQAPAISVSVSASLGKTIHSPCLLMVVRGSSGACVWQPLSNRPAFFPFFSLN
ncbi:hypothetical protein AMECASPLE_027469 [Ameca splendens]|uniref:Uncharacterized protein n=1 Tax=Ameca splendens TaxID=208324 RepID=A0ABV1ABI5_9TELE